MKRCAIGLKRGLKVGLVLRVARDLHDFCKKAYNQIAAEFFRDGQRYMRLFRI